MKDLTPRMIRTIEWLRNNSYLEVTLVSRDLPEYRARYRAIKGRNPPTPTVAKHTKKKGGSEYRIVIPIRDRRYQRALEVDFGLAPLSRTADGKGWRKGIGSRTGDLFWRLLSLGFDVGRTRRAPAARGDGVVRRAAEEEKRQRREFAEGGTTQIVRELQQRNASLIRLAKMIQPVTCAVCGFDFAATYGKLGEGFIEAHHLKLLSSSRSARNTSVDDIRLVCANCHRMIHRRKPMLTIEALRAIVERRRR